MFSLKNEVYQLALILIYHALFIFLATKNILRGRLSDWKEMDLALGLDDSYDELAVESLKLAREEKDVWFEAAVPVETTRWGEVDRDDSEVDGLDVSEDVGACAKDGNPF